MTTNLMCFWEGFNGYPPDVWNSYTHEERESFEHGRRTAASIAARNAQAERQDALLVSLVAELREEVRRLRNALETIRNEYGRVCEGFEMCHHASCNSSYAAWAVADLTLNDAPALAAPPTQEETP